MNKRIVAMVLSLTLLLMLPMGASAEQVVEVPITVSVTEATGIDLNLRVDPNFVEKAELVQPAEILNGTTYLAHQNGAKVKVAISGVQPITFSGTLFYLRLTLKKQAQEAELCKLLQVTVNEKITRQAADCLLFSGVKDGGVYLEPVCPGFNEGTATLNGAPFSPFTAVTEEGSYTLEATDLNGKKRAVSFVLAWMPKEITGRYPVRNGVVLAESLQMTPDELLAGFDRPFYAAVEGETLQSGTKIRWEHAGTVYHELTLRLQGDTDQSGTVDTADVVQLLRYLVGYNDFVDPVASDLDANGRLSVVDAVINLRYLSR